MAAENAGTRPGGRRVAVIGLAGLATAGLLYAVGRAVITPDYTMSLFGRAGLDAIVLKSWLASVALGLAAVQVLLALWIYGKLPLAGRPRKPVRLTHRVVGTVAFALTLPVAIHCAFAYGARITSARVVIHSIAGCFLYGAFVAKVLLVHSKRLPGWALPVAGGLLAVVIAVLWYTSALWYYNGFSLPG